MNALDDMDTTMMGPQDFCWLALDAQLASLRAEGADAQVFLQGQLSSDLRQLTAGRAQLSSYNSSKGRMLAVLLLRRRGEAIELELPPSLLEAVGRRLRMYVLRARVSLQAMQQACLGLRGPGAAQALIGAGLPAPALAWEWAEAGGLLVQRRPGEPPRFSIHGDAAAIEALRRRWAAAQAPAALWQHDDILAGVPVVLPETQDRFVPQMANLDLLGGIGFDKGCYTGQEIVARLHYLGQLKRRMFLCRGAGAPPAAGAPVHDGDEAQSVGDIVQSAPQPQGGFVASAVLQLSHAQSPALQLADGTALSASPYAYAAGAVTKAG